MSNRFSALQTSLVEGREAETRLVTLTEDDLPPGEVFIRVHHSCLNYKDALSAAGHKGVSRYYPHTPGIDAAGTVISDSSGRFVAGTRVLASGYDLGMNTAGGLAERIRVPAGWVCACPETLSLRDAMTFGTAGLTAAIGLHKLERMGANPGAGDPLLITGASGGVGSLGIILAAWRGYRVTAMSGKVDMHAHLKALGASDTLDAAAWRETTDKPLLKPEFHYALDALGGVPLFNILKATRPEGAVASCGLVAGAEFRASVYPFILRGVSLLGVDSAEYPLAGKQHLWHQLTELAGQVDLAPLRREITLAEAPEYLQKMLAGESRGRVVVTIAEE